MLRMMASLFRFLRHDLFDIQIMEPLQFLGHRIKLIRQAAEFIRGMGRDFECHNSPLQSFGSPPPSGEPVSQGDLKGED